VFNTELILQKIFSFFFFIVNNNKEKEGKARLGLVTLGQVYVFKWSVSIETNLIIFFFYGNFFVSVNDHL
jgi:hypothetical protein